MGIEITHEMRRAADLKTNPRNARTHPKRQIQQITASISEFGFVSSLVVDETGQVIAGHGRLEAAKSVPLTDVPCFVVRGATRTQKRRLALLDNKIALNAGWNQTILAEELGELSLIEDFDFTTTGFEIPEVDQIMFDQESNSADPDDDAPDISLAVRARYGDLWELGSHRILCGDARDPAAVEALCGGRRVAAAFMDPPYNVRIADVVGRGRVKHSDFAMASGEMASSEFTDFLTTCLRNAVSASKDGAVHYVCMDWRHIAQLHEAGAAVYGQMLNLIVWVKSNGGQGSFYRSQHELIGVFRVGDASHLNNVALGKFGRSRSNVWNYAGVNTFSKDRLSNLASHPTVKPVAMIADALKDCSKKGDDVLDLFGGSGSTLLAAERVGRRALLMEIDPRYVDVTIRRWQSYTGMDAIHAEAGIVFNDVEPLEGAS